MEESRPLVCDLRYTFNNNYVFRATLLSMLRPFDIAKTLLATGVEITPEERKRQMDPMYDIVEDTRALEVMVNSGVMVKVLGADLCLMEQRVKDTAAYLELYGDSHVLRFTILLYEPTVERGRTSKRYVQPPASILPEGYGSQEPSGDPASVMVDNSSSFPIARACDHSLTESRIYVPRNGIPPETPVFMGPEVAPSVGLTQDGRLLTLWSLYNGKTCEFVVARSTRFLPRMAYGMYRETDLDVLSPNMCFFIGTLVGGGRGEDKFCVNVQVFLIPV